MVRLSTNRSESGTQRPVPDSSPRRSRFRTRARAPDEAAELTRARAIEASLRETLRKRTIELWDAACSAEQAQKEARTAWKQAMNRLGLAADLRECGSLQRADRVARYAYVLARRIGIERAACDVIRAASRLHDVGTIALRDYLIRKRGTFTSRERKAMQRHTEIGWRLLTGSSSSMLETAATIAWTHHERFDGNGYPRMLSGEAIPIEGRICALASVFDALTIDRPYRRSVPLAHALELLREERGRQFDPLLVDSFFEGIESILETWENAHA